MASYRRIEAGDVGGSPYGTPPYHESAARAALRYLGVGLQGLSAVPRGANFGEAFLASAGGAARASQAAQQAAQEYAMKQEQARADAEYRDLQKLDIQSQIEARAKQQPEKDTRPWYYQEKFFDYPGAAKLRQKDEQIKPEGDKAETGLVQIDTPTGPKYVRPSQALGKSPPKKTPPTKPSSGAEKTALAFYNRAKSSEDTLAMADKFGTSLEDRIAKLKLPQQVRLSRLPNMMQTPDMQVYRQAQRSFTEARLRKESGATIPQGEYDTDAMTYFAQPGDSKEVMLSKRAKRKVVLDGLKFQSGKAYKEYYEGVDSEEPSDGTADPLEGFYAPQ